jgi:hypothetical protein
MEVSVKVRPYLLLLLFLVCAAPASATTISIVPSVSTQTVGQGFALNIDIVDAPDTLFAYAFDIEFSSAFLAATGTSDGSVLSSGGDPVDFIPGDLTVPGFATAITGTILGGPSGPLLTTSGTLATISFLPLAVTGGTSISLTNLTLLDSSLAEILVGNVAGARVIIQPSQVPNQDPVPEPASMLLIGTGLATAAFRRARKQSR